MREQRIPVDLPAALVRDVERLGAFLDGFKNLEEILAEFLFPTMRELAEADLRDMSRGEYSDQDEPDPEASPRPRLALID